MKYMVSEFLVFVAALAVLSFLGIWVAILFILIQGCGRWIIRTLRVASQAVESPLRIESDLPSDKQDELSPVPCVTGPK
jgi:hypothetical protein